MGICISCLTGERQPDVYDEVSRPLVEFRDGHMAGSLIAEGSAA